MSKQHHRPPSPTPGYPKQQLTNFNTGEQCMRTPPFSSRPPHPSLGKGWLGGRATGSSRVGSVRLVQHAVTSTESAKQYTDSEVREDLARPEASCTPALCTKECAMTHVRACMGEELHRRTRGLPPLPPHFVLLEHKKEGLRHGLILQAVGCA